MRESKLQEVGGLVYIKEQREACLSIAAMHMKAFR